MPKRIPLTQGKFAIVDDEDFAWLSQWKWQFSTTGYAVRVNYLGVINGRKRQSKIYMHRVILKTPSDRCSDHIDGDRLNNIRSNLRICSQADNSKNMRKTRGSSIYKGVSLEKRGNRTNQWRAAIRSNGITKNLGQFYTEREAALAYNMAAIKYHGDFARLNVVL